MSTLIPKFDLKDGGATPTGSVNRPINEKLAETVSIKDFGAVGDGITNDTTAIQNAINSALQTGKSVYVPTGTYLYTSTNYSVDVVASGKSFVLFGDGPQSSIIKYNANGIAFNLRTDAGLGLFVCDNMGFELISPATNSNATCFYISNSIGFGAGFSISNSQFTGFTNCAIQAIRAYNSSLRNCWIAGSSAYTSSSGLLTAYEDAGIRLWGADGTLTVQDHSWSGLNTFEDCQFSNTKYGVDGWNIVTSSFRECTFQHVWVGFINRQNPSGASVSGFVSNAEKGGGGLAQVYINECWFEDYALYAYSNVNLNGTTGADVSPLIRSQLNIELSVNYFNEYGTKVRNGSLDFTKAVVFAGDCNGVQLFTTSPDWNFFYGFSSNPSTEYYKFQAASAYIRPNLTTLGGLRTTYESYNSGDNSTAPFHIGIYQLWVDSSGRLRIKNSTPTSDTDGTIVGTQS